VRLPSREDTKCFAFIGVLIFSILLATFYFQFVIRFVLLIFFYWYISIPIIIISFSSIDFAFRRARIKKKYMAINSKETQEFFKGSSGENPLENGKLTNSYKNWLIQKVATPKYKIKNRTRFSPRDIRGLVVLIIILIAIILVFLTIYSMIFPDYRLPVVW